MCQSKIYMTPLSASIMRGKLPSTHNTGGVSRNDLEQEHGDKRVQKRERLLARSDRTCATVVECTDRNSGGGGGGERQFLLHDIVLAERDDEEYTEESSTRGERDELAYILFGEHREQVETVHGRDSRDEEDADTTGSRRGGLDSAVLLGAERTTEEPADDARFRQCLGDGLDDGITEDGLCAYPSGNGRKDR